MESGTHLWWLALALALASLMGCSELRSREESDACESYADLAPSLQTSCASASCHAGASPAGSYLLDSYEGLLGTGTNQTPNAIAGDASSALLVRIDPTAADATHQAFDELHARLAPWVIDCDLRYSDGRLHEPGIMDPSSDDFHGQLLRDVAYNYNTCASCHGDDFSGGIAGSSCLDCHEESPDACVTCHRDELRGLGGHDAHIGQLMGELDFRDCVKCHLTPSAYDDVGHILLADGTVDPPPVEITFGDVAATDPPGGDRMGPPAYDFATGTCAEVYCHGDVFVDTNASLTQPVWDGAGQTFCGSCHGVGPSTHVQNTCSHCHQQVIDDTGWVGPELHVDGTVQIGRHGPFCNSCHGTQGSFSSPPLSLSGGSSPSLLAVGAHQTHVEGPNGIDVPYDCSACHLVPSAINDPGHIDSPLPAEVFPDQAGGGVFQGKASANGATPTWDRVTGACSTVYCHGGGTTLSGDANAGNQVPDWTAVGQGEAACGACHGLPPTVRASGAHSSSTNCTGCHSGTFDGMGNLDTDTHLNGMPN